MSDSERDKIVRKEGIPQLRAVLGEDHVEEFPRQEVGKLVHR